MKKIILLLCLSYGTNAQILFGLKLGAEQVKVNHPNFSFEYIDESPSQDHIWEFFSIQNNYTPITIIPYLGIQKDKLDIELDFKLGLESEFRTMGTSVGLFKYFGNTNKGTLGIGGLLSMGKSKAYLGDIYQNDTYIQINGSKYYEKSLSVNYYEQQIAIKPQIRYKKMVNNKYPLTISFGYQYPLLSFNGKVLFSGEDPNQEDGIFQEEVSLNRRNITFYTDGVQRKKQVFNQQGFILNIGIAVPLE